MLSPVCVTARAVSLGCWTFSADHEERIVLFTEASKSDPDLPFGTLLRCVHSCSLSTWPGERPPRILETQDDFVQLKTSRILTVLLRFVRHSPLLSTEIATDDLQRRESSPSTVAIATSPE
jgi:hypothetical protein